MGGIVPGEDQQRGFLCDIQGVRGSSLLNTKVQILSCRLQVQRVLIILYHHILALLSSDF